MNFSFTTAGGAGPQFITSQLPVTKIQQGVPNNGGLSQVVGMVGGVNVNMGDGVQYVRTLDGGATLQAAAPQLITLPISLPGAKPGDPQQTVQIQVLSQPKYQMQIPIQGFQQGGAVLTVAYTPEANDGVQLVQNTLPEGFQMVSLPQELQTIQDNKQQVQQILQQQQLFTQQPQQIIINNNETKTTNNNNNEINIIIKEECDDTNDDESSMRSSGTESTNEAAVTWSNVNTEEIVTYLNKTGKTPQTLPVSLQQFLILNSEAKKSEDTEMKIDVEMEKDTIEEASPKPKRKKKYRKKSPKPAKPKPGQVVITAGTDGEVIYCCPECHLAYNDKEELEKHLAVHQIERRFICGICGAGLKRKEHLERHKLGHNPERPYVCTVCCKGFKRREHLNLHTVIHSGVKTEMCLECGKGFYRRDHLRKHIRSHETRRLRDGVEQTKPSTEITIHVPTSANVQVPVQINIPQHVVTSLAAQQAAQQANQAAQSAQAAQDSAQRQLDALLAQHT